MRTTLDIDDAVLAAAKALAQDRGTSIGAALSALARRGLEPEVTIQRRSGFPVFDVAPDAPPITLDLVNEFRDAP